MSQKSAAHFNEIIVFDFDGTITTRDTFALFLRYYAGTARWAFKILQLSPIFLAYGLKLIDRNRVKAKVIYKFFKGEKVEAVEVAAAKFANEVIPHLIRPAAQAALDEAKNKPESLYICSASITPYLKTWCENQNIPNLLATDLEQENGVYTGRIKGWNIWGPGKIRRILAEFAPYSVRIREAYGDSRGDKELLHAAEVSNWRPFRLIAHQ
ncbi:MAG: HAD-IB family hydrolase [Hellea sp.]|nr:HAD-IB family hydrolase [Hellea sp.]